MTSLGKDVISEKQNSFKNRFLSSFGMTLTIKQSKNKLIHKLLNS